MAMVTRYFDVPPSASSLGYGILGDLDYKRRKKAEREAAEARHKKNWTIGAAAVGTALTAGLAAPALGLAGAAGTGVASAGAGSGFAAGTALTAEGLLAAAPTAGLLGTGGVVGLGGYLTAGALGAQAGSMFADDNIAGGLGALASPFVDKQRRAMAADDRATGRAERLSDFEAMEGIRTAGDIRKLMEARNINTYGATGEQIAGMATEAEGRMLPGGAPLYDPMAGGGYGALGPEPSGSDPVTAMGAPREPNLPGPGPVPGTKRDWTPAQNVARMKLMADYSNTVENPEWIRNHTPEDRAMRAQALGRALNEIRVTTLPERPRPMLPGPGGKPVPAQLGVNILPDGSKAILQANGELDYRDAPKDFTKNFTADWTPEQTAAYQRKQIPDYDKMIAEGHRFFTQPTGVIEHIKPEAETQPFKWDWAGATATAEADQIKRYGKADDKYEPDPAETKKIVERRYETARELAQKEQAGEQLRDAMGEVLSRSPSQPISEQTASGIARAVLGVYGPNKETYPKDIRRMVEDLDLRMRMQTGRRR
jgi:hypothetical protein